MNWVRNDGQPNPLDRLGMGKGFFRRFADSFWKATGMELDLVYADGEPWNSVAGRVKSPTCREHALSGEEAGLCEECFQSACRVAVLQSKFHTASCFAGRSFSVCPLDEFDGSGVLLLTGRVRKTAEGSSGTKSEIGYQGALDLIELFLPYLRVCLHMDLLLSARDLPKVVRDACGYVDNHFADKISVADVAAACEVSEDYLSHSFSKQTGNRLSAYIAAVRIGHTMYLLRDQNLGIAEIAFEVGFQSLSQFNRTFRKLRGMTPSEFRKLEGDGAC